MVGHRHHDRPLETRHKWFIKRMYNVNPLSQIHSSLVSFFPAGTRRNDSVFTTSKRRRFDVMKTLSLRHYFVMSPLGSGDFNWWGYFMCYACSYQVALLMVVLWWSFVGGGGQVLSNWIYIDFWVQFPKTDSLTSHWWICSWKIIFFNTSSWKKICTHTHTNGLWFPWNLLDCCSWQINIVLTVMWEPIVIIDAANVVPQGAES